MTSIHTANMEMISTIIFKKKTIRTIYYPWNINFQFINWVFSFYWNFDDERANSEISHQLQSSLLGNAAGVHICLWRKRRYMYKILFVHSCFQYFWCVQRQKIWRTTPPNTCSITFCWCWMNESYSLLNCASLANGH